MSRQAPTSSSTDPDFADRSNTLPTTGGRSAEGWGKSRLSGVQGGWGSDAPEVRSLLLTVQALRLQPWSQY